MKKIEINSKAVNKLSMAVLITSSLLLGGCGGPENDKPKENTPTDVEKDLPTIEEETSKKVNLKKMSREETLKLTAGMEIDKEPDREALESIGLDYEFDMIVDVEYEDGRKSNVNGYFYDIPEILNVNNIEDETGKYRATQKFNCIRILPIQSIETFETGYVGKQVILSDGTEEYGKIINEANIEKIQAILGSISYVITNHRNLG